MKKTVVDYMNLGLAGVFIVLVLLYGIALIQKKEFNKVKWSAKIISVSPDSTDEKSGMLKILDVVFINTFNNSENRLDYNSPKLIVSKGTDSAYFWSQDDLLPDSLSVKYFSVEEKKFYQLNTKLPLEKMQNALDNKSLGIDLKMEIQPKGKILLKIEQPENKNFGSKLIEGFLAKEIPGTLKMLVYREYAGEKYNDFPSLKGISDYSDVLIQKYTWMVKVETENSEDVSEISVYAFDGKSMRTENETYEDAKLRNLPNRFSIDWGNTQRYGSNYSFDSQEILDAFKALNQIKSSEPALITFKVFKNAYPKAEISKGGKTIPLKDAYPDLPTKYAH
ncbi:MULTISPECIES: hypothetical protein [unclassified Chryseobacterium]|uniref:hypothetical protein n=1 Tax=unclassified Chryseobacterium TaxID=2593645 RepID=UPI00100BD73E|nr:MULTISPECIES: hypothetical protein [unclassified Chryseobacterium]RXM53452.1 hypothetical protein BOQ64_03575 [Chryseobacterium sp. CH25]RXM65346.1 hypothetical protein BOQ60_05915 [Chryseobacterium sp. CH1]